MQVSDKGLIALIKHEGIVPAPYYDSVGVLTYGIGHTAAAGAPYPSEMKRGMPEDLDAALCNVMKVFRIDVARYAADVNRALRVEVAQHEFDALVSIHYNTGAIARATFTQSLNLGNRKLAAQQIMDWKKPASIIPRRTAERDLFLHGTYPKGGITVWKVSADAQVIWTPVRALMPAEALAMLAQVIPAPDAPVAAPPLVFGSIDPRNRQVQVILSAMGLYKKSLDEKWGQGQQDALDAFNQRHTQINSIIKGE